MTDDKGVRTELAVKQESKIAAWGDRSEVREIARRVQIMAPGARKLSENEALALAQGAVAHGLDPFNGEIWYIPGSGLMVGIKGLRKAAREQLPPGANAWPEFQELLDPDERTRLAIPLGALAYRCIIRDSETIRSWSESFQNMNKENVPLDLITQVIGTKPYVEGIGYADPNEKSKMSTAQLAMKRAEADALKRRFDLPFAFGGSGGDVVEGEWTDVSVDAVASDVLESPGVDAEVGESDAYEGPSESGLFQEDERLENQWEDEVLDVIMALGLARAKPHAINRLNKSTLRRVPFGQLKKMEGVAYMLAYDKAIETGIDNTSGRVAYADTQWSKETGKAADLIASLD